MELGLALQWSLDETADRFLRVGRDLMRAATVDNVQPLAIMACEQFGATLPICPMTRLKVEKCIRSQKSSLAIAFLKATVGFANGGTIVELSKSIAGVNFLALATALISVDNTFSAATAIQMMIMDTAADKTMVPSAYQLKDLLDVLEPQLTRLEWLTDVLAWKDWWTRNVNLTEEGRQSMREFGGAITTSQSVLSIVTALRKVSRIGEAKTVNITIGEPAPWLTAFTKWCLGEPPSIYTSDGQCLLDHPQHPVKIVYSLEVVSNGSVPYDVRLEVINAFNDFTEIIECEGSGNEHYAAGMVNIQSHAKGMLSAQGLDNDLRRHTSLIEALPYALDKVRRYVQYIGHLDLLTKNIKDSPPIESNSRRPNMFPSSTIIGSVMKKYLSLTSDVHLRPLPSDVSLVDLPEVRGYTEGLDSITASNEMAHQMQRISVMTVDILAISLFHGC